MITGYNTDVRHRETVFHVQTEDKGVANPFIESFVYVGGQVLASKRAGYADLLAEGKDEREIVALMDLQHRTMIAAIRHGKFDAKLEAMGGPAGRRVPTGGRVLPPPGSGAFSAPPASPAAVASPAGYATPPKPTPLIRDAARPAESLAPDRDPAPPIQMPGGAPAPPTLTPAGSPAHLLDIASARPPASSPPASATAFPERTLDQVILEYLTNEADQEQLVLVLEGEPDLGLGQRAALSLRTSSSKSGLPVAGAQVSVRMISTSAEPRVLAAGRTDEQGALPLRFNIPPLDRGTAALIISAVSAIGRAELKHLL
ncbi:MAG TPA: hypothetical protein VHQ90_17950 [Thermoanaerobaculia bacterium]|nr:hypothetical protein [Thermoanaerobaculia bacterium]